MQTGVVAISVETLLNGSESVDGIGPVDMKKTAKLFFPMAFAQVCDELPRLPVTAPEKESRVPGCPAQRWLTATTS